jgi:hypothetical protein
LREPGKTWRRRRRAAVLARGLLAGILLALMSYLCAAVDVVKAGLIVTLAAHSFLSASGNAAGALCSTR